MRKSQYVFIIMAVAYIVIAILNLREWVTVSENILFGLSMSALFSSLSDIFSNIVGKRIYQNEFDYIIKITSDFLAEKISNNPLNSLIDIRNVKQNVENISKGYKKAVHPNEYCKRKVNVLINISSQICFILSITVFILAPFHFPLSLFQNSYSVLATLIAFAAMCFNLYIEEIIADIIQKKTHFFNDTQLIIQIAYTDFMDFLNSHLYHYENCISRANKQEDEYDAHT